MAILLYCRAPVILKPNAEEVDGVRYVTQAELQVRVLIIFFMRVRVYVRVCVSVCVWFWVCVYMYVCIWVSESAHVNDSQYLYLLWVYLGPLVYWPNRDTVSHISLYRTVLSDTLHDSLNKLLFTQEMMHPSSGLLWSPWFRIIAQKWLQSWWANLDDVLHEKGGHQDLSTVHHIL